MPTIPSFFKLEVKIMFFSRSSNVFPDEVKSPTLLASGITLVKIEKSFTNEQMCEFILENISATVCSIIDEAKFSFSITTRVSMFFFSVFRVLSPLFFLSGDSLKKGIMLIRYTFSPLE